MQNIYDNLKSLLEKYPQFCTGGKIFKNVVVEAALNLDHGLLKLLLSDEIIKNLFFIEIEGIMVFDKVKFQSLISNKQFLPDSYTHFKNKIGLTVDQHYLTDSKEVVLSFPYKDCILEGNQTKNKEKRQEVFWNKTLAANEIDRLFEPKALTNFQLFTKSGIKKVSDGTLISKRNNYLIKGNNLLALHSLKALYSNSIKLIYIDPPYNTGKDSFGYNDKFNHSTWLTFMSNRLTVARDLLKKDGSIWVSLDDNEVHYCKVLLDEIFGRDNFVTTIIWHSKYTVSNDAKHISYQHENILVYAKDINSFETGLLPRSEALNKSYRNPDKDPKGDWKATPIYAKSGTDNSLYSYKFKNGIEWKAPVGCFPRYSKSSLEKLDEEGRLYFNSKGNVDKKTYLSEVKQGVTPGSVWTYDEVGHSHSSNEELASLLGRGVFENPKGTRLIKQIIRVGNVKDGEVVLDFFGGSGTTGSAVIDYNHENHTNIKFILCEQMEYILSTTAKRLAKSLSLKNDAQSFVYCELLQLNAQIISDLSVSTTLDEVLSLKNKVINLGGIHYSMTEQINSLFDLYSSTQDLNNLKHAVLDFIEYNLLYINVSEIDDKDLKLTDEDILLTKQFYNI